MIVCRESLPPHVQACVECYKSGWKVVRYNHRSLSSSTSSRSNLSKTIQPSPKQEYEVDFQMAPSEASSELGKFIDQLIVYQCSFIQFLQFKI